MIRGFQNHRTARARANKWPSVRLLAVFALLSFSGLLGSVRVLAGGVSE